MQCYKLMHKDNGKSNKLSLGDEQTDVVSQVQLLHQLCWYSVEVFRADKQCQERSRMS